MPRTRTYVLVVALAFLALFVASGVRATPTVLITPLQEDFGWGVGSISLAIGLNYVLFAIMAPFSAALMERFGVRWIAGGALLLLGLGAWLTIAMSALWQFNLLWGVVIGSATGCLSSPLVALVSQRWFVRRRGLVTGLLSAAYATGQLTFLPLLAVLTNVAGWQAAVAAVAGVSALSAPIFIALMRDRPADAGLPPFGGDAVEAPPGPAANPFRATVDGLLLAVRTPAFWYLGGAFFICGATTVGLVATHFVPAAHDHGISEVTAASVVALIGAFDLVGVTASGWLTDRYDPRLLLVTYYSLRGLSLLALPAVIDAVGPGMITFAVVYGLDWVATVPPTVALTIQVFGRERASIVFGWIFAMHQLGAAAAAWGAGEVRAAADSYTPAFLGAGALGLVAAALSAGVLRGRRPAAVEATSG
jgi:predicted MFS family arabinose efflux permease